MIPFEVAGLIDEFNVGPLSVNRPALPTLNAHGEYEPGLDAPVTLDPVAVHTASGRELDQVPEADRHRETIFVACKTRLYAADSGHVPDVLSYRGRSYRVVTVHDYELQGLVFHALAVLVDARVADQVAP